MSRLKVIYVVRINKSAEVLAGIARRSVTSQSELTSSRELLNLFAGARANPKRRIIDTTALLAKQGFISVGSIDDEVIYKITSAGSSHLRTYRNKNITVTPQQEWAGKWYLVTFEVPETRRAVRNNLIIQLKRQGFINYTKGLWVIPYDPTAFVEAVRRQLDLKNSIKIIIASHLDDEKDLQKKFAIKKDTE